MTTLTRSTWGKNIQITIFGTSHGEHIGVEIHGFPAGLAYDYAHIAAYMARRAPGGALATSRKEPDVPQLLSGFAKEGDLLYTNGEKIEMRIANTNQRSSDYGEMTVPRPGHADYPAHVKYGGQADLRGGGHFSGRLTAPLTWAGALCALYLRQRGIEVGAHICRIGSVTDTPLDPMNVTADQLAHMRSRPFPTIDPACGEAMMAEIARVQAEGDSIGAKIQCVAVGLPVGVGEHMFRGVEGTIASIMLGIPAVKGVEFGAGFDFVTMQGSQANDQFRYEDGKVITNTNHCGGVLGGMTNGSPIVFRVAFKPTPSIFQPQDSVNLATGENEVLEIKGRHDPCAALRAVPVVEAAAAVALMDLMMD